MNAMSATPKSHSPRWANWGAWLLVPAVLIALNVALRGVRLRTDLTAGRIYTLTPQTGALVRGLERPVTLKFYFSNRDRQAPMPLKQYGRRIQDLLAEYVALNPERLRLEVYSPEPDTEEEEWAQRYGVQPQGFGGLGAMPGFYLGLVAVSGRREAAIPVIAPQHEPQLEYQITRLIQEVTRARKPRVGVLSSLPLLGEPPQPFMRRPSAPGWIAFQEARREYDLVRLDPGQESLPDDLDALCLVHPQELAEPMLYALDTYVRGGGRLLAFVDPFSLAAQEQSPAAADPFGGMAGAMSDLNRLTSAWGYEIAPQQVVADPEAATPVSVGSGRAERLSAWLSLRGDQIAGDEAATSALGLLMLPFAGAWQGEAAAGLDVTPLLVTSAAAGLQPAFAAMQPGTGADPAPQGPLALAVRLNGIFPSAFPEGPPGDAAAASETFEPRPGIVILVADVDLLADRYALAVQNFFGQTVYEPLNDNLALFLNLLEQATGNAALLGLRSRQAYERPFERVLELERQAQQRWHEEEARLVDELRAAQARLDALQQARGADKNLMLSAAQRQEVERFRQERFETQRKLKTVRQNLRRDIQRLGFRLNLFNLAFAPGLLSLYGLWHGWRRRRLMNR
ncbi:MAG: Gldg family protein [Candidatus Marinimicrobia bacterium]|nr:Gldg family protein [Candidatus Neomarinimicrobiota bacterium]